MDIDGKRLYIIFYLERSVEMTRRSELLMSGAGGLVSLLTMENSVFRSRGSISHKGRIVARAFSI